ncbi:ATP-binding protein, partial [Patescibacteria group bacterium]|nr:ATP-binding protein [Patescibacteria group bacterium]
MAIKTIIEIHNLTDLVNEPEGIDLINDEVVSCKNAGDFLGAGEWLASEFYYVKEQQTEEIFSKVVAFWASPLELRVVPCSIDDLISRIDEFVKGELALALIAAILRLRDSGRMVPERTKDLSFRLRQEISSVFGLSLQRPVSLYNSAVARLDSTISELLASVETFVSTNSTNAKAASIDVVKKARQLKGFALAEERPILSEIDILLGPTFRKFCEACERQDMNSVIKRAPDLKKQTLQFISSSETRTNSVLWNQVPNRIALHIIKLVNESTHKAGEVTTPFLKLSSNIFKIDLSTVDKEVTFFCRLLNEGQGRAIKIIPKFDTSKLPIEISIKDPREAFEIEAESEQILTFSMILKKPQKKLCIHIVWMCRTLTNSSHRNEDKIIIEQQHVPPDWEKLMEDPPYTINPIKKREDLYGRDTILNDLLLHASAGTSTFLWGQKRVGKTSVLQVLGNQLRQKDNFVCVILRMGELGALHEGQIAYTVAKRISDGISDINLCAPNEQEFGAGMYKLVPFVENLTRLLPEKKFVVIIDEFDDIDPAFYIGERGKLFVKALRSLSELGLTFFFVGSERMNTIYTKHAEDLNKWLNIYLDCIESPKDCKELIVQPVKEKIEYQSGCVDFILNYSGRNPFYMHLLCSAAFKVCWQEQRTYVGESDLVNAQKGLVRSLGETNFAHFWNDDPMLDEEKKIKHAAENCLVLSCISSLGGSYGTIDDLLNVQDNLNLGISEKLSRREINAIVNRLCDRKVISPNRIKRKNELNPPIFKDWLS